MARTSFVNLKEFPWEYEYCALKKLKKEARTNEQMEKLAKHFRHTYRLIDDLLFTNCENLDQYLPTLYDTTSVELSETTPEKKKGGPDRARFIGVELSANSEGTPVFNVYDKRKEFPFEVILYPHYRSNVNKEIFTGVILGQLHRFKQICTYENQFLNQWFTLAQRCLLRYYPMRLLKTAIRKFTIRNLPTTQGKGFLLYRNCKKRLIQAQSSILSRSSS